jgi:hypothetical protein
MATPKEDAPLQKIDLKKEIEKSEWKEDPKVIFEQKASLAIALWILGLFAGVYLLGFIATFLFPSTRLTPLPNSHMAVFSAPRFC